MANEQGISRVVNFGPSGPTTSTVGAADIGTGAVTSTKVADGAITEAKLDATLAAKLDTAVTASAATALEGVSAATSGANQSTGIAMQNTPAKVGMYANLNGIDLEIGDGVKTKDFYFSSNSGTTAKALNAVVAGDYLYWTRYRESFNLTTADRIRVKYDATYTAFATTGRAITAGSGLIGGGTLDADRTINVASADGTIAVNADSIEATGTFANKPVTTTASVSIGAMKLAYVSGLTFTLSDVLQCTILGGVRWAQDLGAPTYWQSQRTGDNTPYDTIIAAQKASATAAGQNKNGAALDLRGGDRTDNGARRGGVTLSVDTVEMVEVAEPISGQRVTSLCMGDRVTANEMPANTGDRVAFLANCATPPTASPVGGIIFYAYQGELWCVGTSGTHTRIGQA